MKLNHLIHPSARLFTLILLIGLFLGVMLALPPLAHAQEGTPPLVLPVVQGTLQTAILLALIANRLTEAVAAPLRKRYPKLDTWWLVYVSWLFGGVLVYFAGLNLFADYFASAVLGQILTAVAIGGGGNILDGIEKWLRPKTATIELTGSELIDPTKT